jgi:hypothetical protein
MKQNGRLICLLMGIILGGVCMAWSLGRPREARAANDRSEDFILCTGAVRVLPNIPTDGVWLLDYKSGKLLATLIDRNVGKIIGWAEVDLVAEFGLAPRENVHFLMTTGMITEGQAALYVAEISSGKFGVYTMGRKSNNENGLIIKRHDLVYFRPNKAEPGKQ